MFSDKANINILTSRLLDYGIHTVVAAPGSRNAPIVRNLCEAGIKCVGVTDERTAGFMALGMADASYKPVAVCVTSGSALLNLAPAVAEASHRRVPLVVISADRSQSRIGQFEGQTIVQPGAFGNLVEKTVSLPEPFDRDSFDYCNRLVKEALMCAVACSMPVHINVPVSEPLFSFNTEGLPPEDMTGVFIDDGCSGLQAFFAEKLDGCTRAMAVVGQLPCTADSRSAIERLSKFIPVLHEPLCPGGDFIYTDAVLDSVAGDDSYSPQLLIYFCGEMVNRSLKNYFKKTPACTIVVNPSGNLIDTFGSPYEVVKAELVPALHALGLALAADRSVHFFFEFRDLWKDVCRVTRNRMAQAKLPYSQAMAVRDFERLAMDRMLMGEKISVHYANSSAVRLACVYSDHYVWVNRGVNGIEGSLSTAAGFSTVREGLTICVIGDLSFFYDSNALWNANIGPRLRILLLNNGGGSIFHNVKGLCSGGPADAFTTAPHSASAEGICRTHNIKYVRVSNAYELNSLSLLFSKNAAGRPILIEVITDAAADASAFALLK